MHINLQNDVYVFIDHNLFEGLSSKYSRWACGYGKHSYDIYSVVLPISTQDLQLFPSLQLITLLNYPVFVKDVKDIICLEEFGWCIFVNLNTVQKEVICSHLSESVSQCCPTLLLLFSVRESVPWSSIPL